MSQRPWQSKANLHPGHILHDFGIQRRTSEQKKADDEVCQQAKDNQAAELQKAYDRIGAMENAMAEMQAKESAEVPIKPLKPHPRPVKKKSLGTVSGQAQGQYPFHIEDFDICSREHHTDNVRAEVAAKQGRFRLVQISGNLWLILTTRKLLGHNLDVPESGSKMKASLKLQNVIEQAHNHVANDVAALATCGEKKTTST